MHALVKSAQVASWKLQENKIKKTLKTYKDVGMACRKVCKQGRDDA